MVASVSPADDRAAYCARTIAPHTRVEESPMLNRPLLHKLPLLLAVLAATALGAGLTAGPASAKSCFKKAGVGNALTEGLAQFQVDAMLLQATDWSIYFTYISGNGTPGYTFGPRTYKCHAETVGWQCHGQATMCKLD